MPKKKNKINSPGRKIKVESVNDDGDSQEVVNKKGPGWKDKSKDFSALYRSHRSGGFNVNKIEKKDPNRKKKILGWSILILLVLLTAALSGFYFFVNQEDKFTGDRIAITTGLPLSVASGDEIGFTIEITNNEEVDLLDTELTVQFPSNFIFNSSEPLAVNEANNAWQLGNIDSGQSVSVAIVGQIFGELDSKKRFTAILNYTPANFLSEFQKQHDFTIDISDSILELDLDFPTKIVSGVPAVYKINYFNNSSEDLKNVRLTLSLPEDLESSNFEPTATREGNVWEFETLTSQVGQEITWQGVLSASQGAMREIKAEIGYIDENGEYVMQASESTILFVVDPQLKLTLSINGDLDGAPLSLGETLNYALKYKNESQSEFKNIAVTITMDSEALDWDSLIDLNNGEVVGQSITWTADQIEDLALIEPSEEGEIKFDINLENNIIPPTDKTKNYQLVSQAKASSSEVTDLDNGSLEVESDILTNKINSRLVLRAEGRYYDDEYLPVGTGPLPPVVGQTTGYRIYWYLQNGANEVTNVEVQAELPSNVTWTDITSVSAGSLSYDEETRIVSWIINKMPIHVGQAIPELMASFDVTVTPLASELGQLLILLQKSTASALDSFTNERLEVSQDLITTDLSTDPLAQDKSAVAEETANSNLNSNTNSL